MIEQALKHIESGQGNCATAAYRALLPEGVEPARLHDHILMGKETRIEHVAACAALATFRQVQMMCTYINMPETETPADYFKSSLSDEATDASEGIFLGGLIRRCFIMNDGRKTGHVLAVTAVNAATNTVEIVDRGPVEYDAYHYKVPVEELNKLVTNQWVGQLARVLLVIGLARDNPLHHSPPYRAGMEKAISIWTAWEQSFEPSFQRDSAGS